MDLSKARTIIRVSENATKSEIDEYLKNHLDEIKQTEYDANIEEAKDLLYKEAERLYEMDNEVINDKLDELSKETASDVQKIMNEENNYIPYTNILKPRERNINETDEEYINYLKEYYEDKFANRELELKEEAYKKAKENFDKINKEFQELISEYTAKLTALDDINSELEFSELNSNYSSKMKEYFSKLSNAKSILIQADMELSDLKNKMNQRLAIEDKHRIAGYIEQKPDPLLLEDKQMKKDDIDIDIAKIDEGLMNELDALAKEKENKEELSEEDKIKQELDALAKEKENKEEKAWDDLGYANDEDYLYTQEEIDAVLKDELDALAKEKENKTSDIRTLDGIMDDLLDGIEIKKGDNKRYTATNIKVSKAFKNKLSQGNYLYNLVGVASATIAAVFGSVNKFINTVRPGSAKAKKRIKELESRINELDEESLMIIYNEYRGTRLNDFALPDIVNTLLGKRISEFVQAKVAIINEELTRLYAKMNIAFHQILNIENEINNMETTPERTKQLETEKGALLNGKASEVARIRELQKEANAWFSGGEHGFSEDMKAARTKMSIVGYRFAKKHDLNNELLHEQRVYKDKETEAIVSNDDEQAFLNFMGYEKFQMDNTKVKNSLLGKRSVGERYYSPLVSELNYKDDPFIRDLFTTIAVVGSAVNIAGNIMEHAKVEQQVNVANERINELNSQVNEVGAKANQYGDQIVAKQDTILKGQDATINQGELAGINTLERMNLDKFGWGSKGLGSKEYKEADALAHTDYNTSYENIEVTMNDIANRYGSGAISPSQAIEEMAKLQTSAQSRLTNIYSEYQPIIREYAETHPQFDLSALENSMNHLVRNSTAVADASVAQADIMRIGEALQGLTVTGDVAGITIAQSIIPTLIGASSAFALAANVATTMSNAVKKGKYGNEVTEMMQDISTEEMEEFKETFKR